MAGLNRTRTNNTFRIITGKARSLLNCDFESDSENDVTEVRPGAREDIVIAIFYRHQKYGLPVEPNLLALLHEWNSDDPPSKYGVWRNDTIMRLQGKRSPFIVDHGQGYSIL